MHIKNNTRAMIRYFRSRKIVHHDRDRSSVIWCVRELTEETFASVMLCVLSKATLLSLIWSLMAPSIHPNHHSYIPDDAYAWLTP